MRILDCFHTIADLDLLSEDDWISGSKSCHIDTSYLKQILNCYDESALELSCRLRDTCATSGISCTCTATTVSDQSAKPFLERMIALGFADAALIQLDETASTEHLASERTAALLYSYINKQQSFDFIFTGTQSGDGSQGKVPFLLAEFLKMRCISNVIDIRPVSENSIFVASQHGTVICEETVTAPAILMIGNIAGTFLRVPTLRQRMQSKTQKIHLYHESALAASASDDSIHLTGMEPVLQQRPSEIFDDADPSKAAKILVDYYKKWI